ncbi:MAG: Ig-like domain-containing protein [Deltaproteobacteria bacterium]|nr:Ig-like domain-containing protein [Deltaproteobacteria bacterium]
MIDKRNQLTKISGSFLFYFLVLSLSFLISACGVVENPGADSDSFPIWKSPAGSSTLSQNIVNELNSDLVAAGYSQTKADAITAGSESAVSAATLSDSTDVKLLVPVILRGAEVTLSDSSLSLAYSDKMDILDITLTCLTRNLNGNIQSTQKLANFFTIPSKAVTGAAYETLMEQLSKVLIQNLDEAGIVSADMSIAIRSVMNSLTKNLTSAGVADEDIVMVTKAISRGAVSSLDEANINVATDTSTVQAVVNGIISGLGGNNSSSSLIIDASAQIVEGAITGLAGAGVSNNDLTSFTTVVKAGVEEGFANSGLSSSDYTTVETALDTAITVGIDTIQSGAVTFPGVTVSSISGNTSETRATATFTVVLDAKPTAGVTIGLSSSDTGEGTVSPSSLTFSTVNWNAPQTVTVTGVDDALVDGDITYTIILAAAVSTDSDYSGLNPDDVTVINVDDDGGAAAGFVVSAISGNTTEAGGSATFTVRLASQPISNVIINIASNSNEGSVVLTSLTFTPVNWESDQIVTVYGEDDIVTDGDQTYSILLSIGTAGSDYSSLDPPDVSVVNIDDEQADFVISAISGDTTEAGGTANFTVRLLSKPTTSVTIGVASDTPSEGTALPTSLTFTTSNWNSPQSVTVTGVDDFVTDGNQPYFIVLSADTTTSDPGYFNNNPPDMSVTNIDNETPGYTFTPLTSTGSRLSTTEAGGMASFSVVLNEQPVNDVALSFSSSDATEGTINGAVSDVFTLTFTSGNWNQSQNIVVTGIDDVYADGNQDYFLTVTAQTTDPGYSSIANPPNVYLNNVDDETALIVTANFSGSQTSETGGVVTFDVSLSTPPFGTVDVSVVSQDTTEGVIASGATLSFTTMDWATPQTVTVMGIADGVQDNDQTYIVSLTPSSAGDAVYNALPPVDVSLINLDNIDVTAPTVTLSPANTAIDVTTDTDIVLAFSEVMDPLSVTTNTGADNTCSGTVQLSNDNFATCVIMNGVSSADNRVFTLTPVSKLSVLKDYSLAIIGARDPSGNQMSNLTTSFTTRNYVWTYLVDGINQYIHFSTDVTADAGNVNVEVFNSKLYVIWSEGRPPNGYKGIRAKVYDPTADTWTSVHGSDASSDLIGMNWYKYDSFYDADEPNLEVHNGKLYATWIEKDAIMQVKQTRVAVYNGMDLAPAWSFVDGIPWRSTYYGINVNYGNTAYTPKLLSSGGVLYDAFIEHDCMTNCGNRARLRKYNGNDASSDWTSVDHSADTGIHHAGEATDRVSLVDFNGTLYATYSTNHWDPVTWINQKKIYAKQLQTAPTVDWINLGAGGNYGDLNFDSSQDASDPTLAVYNNELYMAWKERNYTVGDSSGDQVRVKKYSGTGTAWDIIDGNPAGDLGINFDNTMDVAGLQFFESAGDLFLAWFETTTRPLWGSNEPGVLRIAKYNGNPVSPVWTFVDSGGINYQRSIGGTDNLINSGNVKVINSVPYFIWTESDGAAWPNDKYILRVIRGD